MKKTKLLIGLSMAAMLTAGMTGCGGTKLTGTAKAVD